MDNDTFNHESSAGIFKNISGAVSLPPCLGTASWDKWALCYPGWLGEIPIVCAKLLGSEDLKLSHTQTVGVVCDRAGLGIHFEIRQWTVSP